MSTSSHTSFCPSTTRSTCCTGAATSCTPYLLFYGNFIYTGAVMILVPNLVTSCWACGTLND
eukprot:2885135-Heterocapsa_arctica.AAC.1